MAARNAWSRFAVTERAANGCFLQRPRKRPPAEGSSAAAGAPNTNGPARALAVVSDETVPPNGTQVGQITLPDAIQIAYRTQPRLRVFLEGIHEAQGNADIAFSPYLPTLAGGISGGGFDLNVQGQAAADSASCRPGAVVPIGLNLESGYGLGDVKLQWLICDFGRRAGRYCQAKLGVEIASAPVGSRLPDRRE